MSIIIAVQCEFCGETRRLESELDDKPIGWVQLTWRKQTQEVKTVDFCSHGCAEQWLDKYNRGVPIPVPLIEFKA